MIDREQDGGGSSGELEAAETSVRARGERRQAEHLVREDDRDGFDQGTVAGGTGGIAWGARGARGSRGRHRG